MKSTFSKLTAVVLTATLGLQACGPKQYPGSLPGAFSVSETNKVQFSQANLKYTLATKTLAFHENQYDCLWEENDKLGGSSETPTAIDVFAYGAIDNPELPKAEKTAPFKDYGSLAISNGGNEPNQWRTLSADEVNYLFFKRPNALKLINFAEVEGVMGCIILPDDFVLPKDAKFAPVNTDCMDIDKDKICVNFKYRNDSTFDLYKDSKYTKEEFKKIEAAGAVFFPLAGQYPLMRENECGAYWTSTGEGEESPYLYIQNNMIWATRGAIMRNYRFAVRLVKDIEK